MADSTIDGLDTLSPVDRTADKLPIWDADQSTTKEATINATLGFSGGDPVSTSDTQTLSNKTLGNTTTLTVKDANLTIQDDSDTTKQAKFQASGITTGTTRTYTLPDASTTVVGTDTTQTLTNKTLTSPTINTATISNPTLTTDAVNEYTAANGVTVDGLNIKDGKLNTTDSVVTANITDSAVTTAKVNDLAVTTAKIADDAVTPAKWTNPYCFRAYASASTTLTDATFVKVLFATENYDYNNNFASSTYTAPVAGVYHFDAAVQYTTGVASAVEAVTLIYVNGVRAAAGADYPGSSTAAPVYQISGDLLLAASDTVEIYHYQNSAGNEDGATGTDKTWFSGHLVHAT